MEDIAPPLKFILCLRLNMENGQSVATSVRLFCEEFPENPFSVLLEHWHLIRNSSISSPHKPVTALKEWTSWRQIVLDMLHLGLQGHPILEEVKKMETELLQACNEQIEKELQTLPFVAMIPIMLCQFPAYLILLFGPWLQGLLKQLT